MSIRRYRFPLLPVGFCLVVSCMSALSNSAAASESPNLKRKANIPGIKDAGKVDEFLYRGAQPSEKGLKELREMGVNTIIDLRDEWPVGGKERTQICAIARHEFCQLTGERMVPAIRPSPDGEFLSIAGWVGTEAGCLLLYTGLHSIDGRQRRRSKKCTPITSRPFCTQT